MNSRELLANLLNRKAGKEQLSNRQPPVHAALNVIAPEGYQPQPEDTVTTEDGQQMTVADWESMNANTTSPARLIPTLVEGATYLKPSNL